MLDNSIDNSSFTNPILPGFYPDPSICRVGEDYVMVNSSFSYYPGIPIFHSRDLVNWKQIGHVLDRPSQLELDGGGHSQGIFAPTIRYNNGIFYVITTNETKGGNFIVTAENPSGPWSNPYWLNDAPGIDPSLFFDDDGRVYCTGTSEVPNGGEYFGDNEIWLKELDLKTMNLIGPRYGLWRGALKNAFWPEGPHLYKKDGYYYLLIAEGGTDYHHSVTIARSQTLFGHYEANPGNPILTHRHLGRTYPIVNAGHADLIKTQKGEWWMVVLASRPYGGYFRNLGRETFLVPVIWEDGWPIVSPGTGKIEFRYQRPNIHNQSDEIYKADVPQVCDDFDSPVLSYTWNMLRTPRDDFWNLTDKPGYLRLKLKKVKLSEKDTPSFLGRRQQHFNFLVETKIEFQPAKVGEVAGIALLQSNEYYFRLEYTLQEKGYLVQLVRCFNGIDSILSYQSFYGDHIYLQVITYGQDYNFFYGTDKYNMKCLAKKVDGRILSTDVAGGFVGTYIGMFAYSETGRCENTADFDYFTYQEIKEVN